MRLFFEIGDNGRRLVLRVAQASSPESGGAVSPSASGLRTGTVALRNGIHHGFRTEQPAGEPAHFDLI